MTEQTPAGRKIGYVRVSSEDQNTDRQLDGIRLYAKYTDKISGKNTNRPGLARALAAVQPGDTLLVHSMDRLARSLADLLATVEGLVSRGVSVTFVKEGLTFTSDKNDIYAMFQLQILGAVAQLERALIRERQREGIAMARARGVYTGRKPKFTDLEASDVVRRVQDGESPTELAREYRVSRSTIYKALKGH